MKKRINQMNVYREELQGGNEVIYSYSTPIILKLNGLWYTSPKKYSQTTSKQKNKVLGMYVFDKQPALIHHEVDHETFKQYCKTAGVSDLGLA